MPKRPKVESLPAQVRAWLDRLLVEKNFSGYEELEGELAKVGHAIGKSSIHRYGSKLARKLEAIKASTHAAAAIAQAAPDDADLRSAAVISMIQTEVFDVLVSLQDAEEADPMKRAKLLSAVAKNVATLTRASVAQKKWEIDVRGRVSAAADAAAKIGTRGGLSKNAVDEIRREILGLALPEDRRQRTED